MNRIILSLFLFCILSLCQAQNSYRGTSIGLAFRNSSPYENSTSTLQTRLYYSATPTDSSDIFAQVGIDFPASLLLSGGVNITPTHFLNIRIYLGLGGIRFFRKSEDSEKTFFNTFFGINLETIVYGPIIVGVAVEEKIFIPYWIFSSFPDVALTTRVEF